MNYNTILENNSLYIIPDNYKNTMLKIMGNNQLMDIRVLTMSELKRKILFDYNEKTIFYLMKEKNISYKNAKEYIDNLYYLTDDIKNSKLIELNNIKKYLDENKLLTYDNYFLNSIKNRNVFVLGFDYLYKFDLFLLKKIESKNDFHIINFDIKKYDHTIIKFKNINEEIEYIANRILDKINEGIEISNIYLANYNSEYESTIKRIFNFYNIPINLEDQFSLYDTKIGIDLLNNLKDYENILNSIDNSNIYNAIIDVFNKYYWANDYIEIKELLIEEFKNIKIKKDSFVNAVNLIDLNNKELADDEYVFLLGFAKEFIPHMHKDDLLILDKEKNEILESTEKLNKIEKNRWISKIKSIKNLTITYSKQGLKDIFYPSPLSEYFNVIEKDYSASLFSHDSNKYNLALLLDEHIKYGTEHQELNVLASNYNDIDYHTYDNQYNNINNELIKEFYKNGLYLSYTKLNTYYECSFKYYLEYILKLNSYQETFEAYLGNLCHYILSKIYDDNFDFEKEKEIFLLDNNFDLNKENFVFIDKMCEELKFAIGVIKDHYKDSLFKEVDCEKNIKIELDNNVIFTGIVDKILSYQNNISIIDYKTYRPNIDLSLVNYGLGMQLPIYIYLIKKVLPDSKIIGIYLQYITRNIISSTQKKTIEEIKKDNLKLVGYTIDNEQIIEMFDSTYSKSDYIKGMSLTSKGFSRYTRLLKDKDFDTLFNVAENIIERAVENILDANFTINPKVLDKTNLSCTYCKYKSVCFVDFDNHEYITADKDLTFLGSDNND